MNRLRFLAGVAVILAGCQTLPDNATVIDRIQAAVITACGYVPTVEFILELLERNWNGADKITAITNAICAVTVSK